MAPDLWVISLGFVGLFGLVYGVGKDSASKRSRIYQRLDEVKESIDSKFTRKDICGVIHEQVSADLKEIKGDVKKLLSKNGIK